MTNRIKKAKESFKNAQTDIPKIVKDLSFFGITRGQYSMIDIVLKCLDDLGPCKLSLWTWVIAQYEVQVVERLMRDGRITAAKLIVDSRARKITNSGNQKIRARIFEEWSDRFGADSIRYVYNHAKIATLEQDTEKPLRVLMRGSMNLNFNPRFEQFDIDEGHPGFDIVRQIESELPVLPLNHNVKEAQQASKIDTAWTQQDLQIFQPAKTWRP